jgi:hypothetical protein
VCMTRWWHGLTSQWRRARSITVYEEKVAVQEISGAHSSFCQCFKMHGEMLSVLSAGGDGRVVKWTIEAGADPILTKQEVVGADPIKEAVRPVLCSRVLPEIALLPFSSGSGHSEYVNPTAGR